MLIATFNCNSIRMRLGVILDWLGRHSPDVLALQETKCQDAQFPAQPIIDAGWHVVYRGQKRYNGVAVITRQEPTEASFGLGDGDDGLSEPRLARVKVAGVQVINTYVPQGRELDSEEFRFKLQWLSRVRGYMERNFDPAASPVVWVGDLNVAPSPIDVHDSKAIWPHVCHCRQATDALADVAAWGLVDVFRKHLPQEGVFTFWDYRIRGAVARNLGWRLDHVFATEPMAGRSTECFVDVAPRKLDKPSDHTFVAARFDL